MLGSVRVSDLPRFIEMIPLIALLVGYLLLLTVAALKADKQM
jgi:hypothetical protein